MQDPSFFGYGSLVNRATHSYPDVAPTRVRGWMRAWQGTSLRELAFLTAVPVDGAEISGLVARVPGADWAALDERERAYARHPITVAGRSDVAIYAVEPRHCEDAEHPILLSYLDTVVQGFLAEFGEAGARDFFATTRNWHLPLVDDRAAPIYPRATVLTAAEQDFVDREYAASQERALDLAR